MSNVQVLFFAADPVSATPGAQTLPLALAEDIREIRERVRAADYPDALKFDYRLAARSEDLRQALNETRPKVVHFSGHGTSEGLVLVGRDGAPHLVRAKALRQLFEAFPREIRLVVLNACLSHPQAKAIADVVGCAIGTRREISDEAAITFGSSLYSAIAFGHSVQVAFEQACAALAMDHPGEEDCPAIVSAPDVDPGALILVPPPGAEEPEDWQDVGWVRAMLPFLLVGMAGVSAVKIAEPIFPLAWQPECGWSLGDVASRTQQAAHPATRGEVAGGHSSFAAAMALRAQGKHAAALPLFRQAAEAGDSAAMGYLGVALLNGDGIPEPQIDSGIDWIQKAAYKHDPYAMTMYAKVWREGMGGRQQSLRRALEWYDKAVRAEWPDAMLELADIYRDRGYYRAAVKNYRYAVQAGSVDALVGAGRMYADGLGVERYPREAVCLYSIAAEAKSSAAMYELGRSYQEGSGVRRDLDVAMSWYLQASKGGVPDATDAVGALYLDGLGVKRDSAAAIRWFRRAQREGSLVAAAHLQELGVE
ncbi:MAG TPA: CHAT domain-containing protein [Longimicrobiaceae bacterium]|jgi:TPR repeat protein|nr:CHAT domain-containing protein [Longimicrobiaceae bacterium]